MNTDWITKTRHVFISGPTRSGKTVLAKQLQAESDRVSVFFNLEAEEGIPGEKATTREEVLYLIRRGRTKINYVTSNWDTEGLQEEHAELVHLLFVLGQRTDIDFQLITDECHEISPKGSDDDSLCRAVKRGAKRGLKCISLSQEPQTVSHRVLQQSEYHVWLGKPGVYAENYFSSYGLPYEELQENEEYQAALINQHGAIEYRFKAKEKYV